jgi:hypothetical protein
MSAEGVVDFLAESRRSKVLKKGKHPGRGGLADPDDRGGEVWFYMGHGGKYKGRFEVVRTPGFLKYGVTDHLTKEDAGQPSLGEIEQWIQDSIDEKSGTYDGHWKGY